MTDETPAKPRRQRKRRTDTKEAMVIDMLRRKEGATIEQICVATGWKPDTARGVLSGSLRRDRGLTVVKELPLGSNQNVYHIVDGDAA